MGNSTPIEPAPAYEDLFHERGSSSRNGYTMVGQTETIEETRDVEHAHHLHDVSVPIPAPIAVTVADESVPHTHCAECDRQRERRERREFSQKACGMVAKTFILIFLFMMILGIVIVGAWKDVRLKKLHG
ncbi:unnamed protein product [Penicillium camemberti]|uniref:Str. FM013 n=1 Tax=Penicillium camemberti (strain FM 013) TaxID=1429867 RepID=A0A0G4PG60_PENC3|nr:unnamed protein product [Penicillium camemberti]